MTRIKDKIVFVVRSIRGDATIVEIIFWWGVRIALLCAAIIDEDPLKKFIFASNLLGTFAFSLLRFVAPKDSFIGRASFHLQTLIIFTSFSGYFVGHATNIHDYIDKYDFVLHMMSGMTMVFIGYYLMKAIDKDKRANAAIMTIGSVGFSFLVMVAWEIFEFFCDYYIPDAANQAYNWNVPEDLFWFEIFGNPQAGAAQYPILDTMIDICLATFTTAITGIIMHSILKRKEKIKKIEP